MDNHKFFEALVLASCSDTLADYLTSCCKNRLGRKLTYFEIRAIKNIVKSMDKAKDNYINLMVHLEGKQK